MLPFQFCAHLSNNTSHKVFNENSKIEENNFDENQPYLNLLLYPNEHSFGFLKRFTNTFESVFQIQIYIDLRQNG